jgi:hypothetical protein
VCPEHEHWQQRTLLNPISTSNKFTTIQVQTETGSVEQENEDELEVLPPAGPAGTGVFGERDPNLPFCRDGGVQKGKVIGR